jgi:outer membrane protein
MKNIIKFYTLTFLFVASPLFAMEGVAVIDMRTAVLSTQGAADAFKALEKILIIHLI